MRFGWFIYIFGIAVLTAALFLRGSNSAFEGMLFTILLFVWIILVSIIIGYKKIKSYKKLPELTTKATVIFKEIVIKSELVPNGEDGYYERETTHHNIIFRTEADNQWTFDIDSKALFDALLEDDYGTLIYKETKENIRYFVSFQRQA